MENLQRLQFAGRLSGTLLRLGWLVSAVAFIPTLFCFLDSVMIVGRAFFIVILILIATLTLFTLFFSEQFRRLIADSSIDILPMVGRIYSFFSALIYALLAVGVALGISVILLSIRERDGKSSRNKIISAVCMIGFLVLGSACFIATKSRFIGAGA